MKICKNKGKTTIVASRQGNMWHLRNGGDGEANASKAGMTKGGKQLPMTSRAKPAPETEATCARRLWPPRQGRRRSAARQPCNSRCRQPQPLQPSNVGGPLTSTHRRLAHHDLHLVSFHMPSVKNNDSTISFHFISRMATRPSFHFISFHGFVK